MARLDFAASGDFLNVTLCRFAPVINGAHLHRMDCIHSGHVEKQRRFFVRAITGSPIKITLHVEKEELRLTG
jgi:hypothetical protein